ncbi:synaptotagmin-8 isoform X2 [Desmodus rotundus]|uniref:synaptotagmin-8 isoform X2 n=1 Tax=Desmodus rotundus TaxID=9430 RepID=UPI002381170B|nr:synaptotagmin-8 isoform X1 [Desmodus rotundus]
MRRDPSQQSGEMGRPPGPHAVPAPAGTTAAGGTTAAPGLIRDLVAWTPCPPRAHPGPRWALMAAAVAAGALMVSCLLCALCCRCRRRPGRKPRDKEAVGLGSPQSSTTTHLVQPEVDGLESSPGGAQKWGCLQLSLEYDFGSQEIRVGLKQAVDLRARDPSGTADPYARISLSAQAGRRHETKVHRGTLCPVFNETCCFHVPPQELPQTTLRVQVLDSRRFSRHEPLGELCLPLGTVGLQHVLEFWHPLGPPSTPEAEPMGELCVSLRYVPSSGQLTVVVLEARGLNLGPAEPYVKVQLALSQRKWKTRKTSGRKSTADPYFNEAFTFHVPFSQVQSVDLVLAVWARGPRLRAEPMGKVVLGARASGQPLQHWADMLAYARRPITQWHRLRPAREVDEALALQPRLRLPVPGS